MYRYIVKISLQNANYCKKHAKYYKLLCKNSAILQKNARHLKVFNSTVQFNCRVFAEHDLMFSICRNDSLLVLAKKNQPSVQQKLRVLELRSQLRGFSKNHPWFLHLNFLKLLFKFFDFEIFFSLKNPFRPAS
ncbi:hypothetical protein BpHYR1_004111 [Brachionus plicatilis]|uniref:Uncharacterized protein n=1 Tax=Brachionus plicatilis TaxID=10195 RepID=A0A3M7R188_BRAPC|nr:hypothetical protein BpHYR1_004111 [Brachionus plicatilis]